MFKNKSHTTTTHTPETRALVKNIAIATIALYALGWAIAFGRQSGWDPALRTTYGYQLGWLTCLAAAALAVLLRRNLAQERTQEGSGQREQDAGAGAPAHSDNPNKETTPA